MNSEVHSVLVVSKDSKISSLISVMLTSPLFELTLCTDFNEARRKVNERNYNIIIVDSGESGDYDFAVDISDTQSTILLMVQPEYFDQISYRVEGYGILTITKPFDSFYFYNMMKIAIAVQYKMQVLNSQTVKLKEKMDEIRLVNRAKMLLMQTQNMTEQEAHHYMEKEAMNRCIKRTVLAEEIIKMYE